MGQQAEDRAQTVGRALGRARAGPRRASCAARRRPGARDTPPGNPARSPPASSRPGPAPRTRSPPARPRASGRAARRPFRRSERSGPPPRRRPVMRTTRATCLGSSGSVSRATMWCSDPDPRRASSQAGPPASARAPAATPSETVTIATRMLTRATIDRPWRLLRPPRTASPEPPALGDRPLQPALRLLHARGRVRLAAARGHPPLRGDRPARRRLRRPRRRPRPADGRRAARAARPARLVSILAGKIALIRTSR